MTSRNKKKYKSWNINNSVKIIDWNKRESIASDILINCTPMGMKNMNILPLKVNSNKQFKYIIDLPINKNTALSKIAKKFNINYIDGQQISLLQGIEQFRIYNGKKLFFNKMKKIFKLQILMFEGKKLICPISGSTKFSKYLLLKISNLYGSCK